MNYKLLTMILELRTMIKKVRDEEIPIVTAFKYWVYKIVELIAKAVGYPKKGKISLISRQLALTGQHFLFSCFSFRKENLVSLITAKNEYIKG